MVIEKWNRIRVDMARNRLRRVQTELPAARDEKAVGLVLDDVAAALRELDIVLEVA
jgi:hypothetical protein